MNGKKRIFILSCIIFSLILMGFGTMTQADAANADTVHYYGIVKEGPLNVRTGPSVAYSSLGKIAEGTNLIILGSKTVNNVKWYSFIYQSKTAYVCGDYVRLVGHQIFYSTAKSSTVFQGPLNVRAKPSTDASIIGSAAYLKVVSVKSLYYKYGSGKWARITWNGQTAYLSAQYVAMNTSASTIKKYSSTLFGTTKEITKLRTGPGTAYTGSTQLPAGKTLGFVGEINNPQGEKWLMYKYAYAIYYIAAQDITINVQSSTTNAQKIVNLAYSKLGCDYVYGDEGPNTFDCSGFVYWVVNNSGISGLSVPRTSDALYSIYKEYDIGKSITNAKPGDIILFSTTGLPSGISHSAIYYKDSKMIHASSSSTGVILTTVAYSTTNKKVCAIIRLPGV